MNCFFIPEWANFFGDRLSESYLFTPTPLFNAYLALPFAVLLVALVFWGSISIASRFHLGILEFFLFSILCFGLVFPINYVRETSSLFCYYPILSLWFHRLFNPLIKFAIPVGFGITVATFYWSYKKFAQQLISKINLLGWILSPIVLIAALNYLYAFSESYPLLPRNRPISQVVESHTKSKTKIVWIIFDEWDYRLSFSERPKGLQLPQLDRLKNETIFSEAAYPPSDRTLHSIPSLLLGEKVDVVEVKPADLILKENHNRFTNKQWTDFPNVFHEAKSLGYSTAVVGWYHTYCRVFKTDLDFCRRLPAGRFGYRSVFWNSTKSILSRSLIFDRRLERSFVFNLEQIKKESIRKLSEDQYDFLFLHFTIPHAPWMKPFGKSEISPLTSRDPRNYLGNLELVDQYIGDIRQALENGEDWDRTLLIVSSDHFWRKSEEYDGKKDFRVPFIIKMPHSKEARMLKKPIATTVTRTFILDVIRNKIDTADKAYQWLLTHSQTFPENTVLSQEQTPQPLSTENSDKDPKSPEKQPKPLLYPIESKTIN